MGFTELMHQYLDDESVYLSWDPVERTMVASELRDFVLEARTVMDVLLDRNAELLYQSQFLLAELAAKNDRIDQLT